MLLFVALGGCAGAAEPTDAAPPDAASDASMTDSGPPGACSGFTAAPPMATPSNREVRIHVTGPSDAFVVTEGDACSPFGVEGVRLALPSHCGCECAPYAATVGGTQLGEGVTVTWNASTLRTYRSACEECLSDEAPAYRTGAVWDAVPAGTYEIELIVLDAPPSGCNQEGDTLRCMGLGPADGTLCTNYTYESRTVTVEVELPAEGDVDVDVVIPPLE